MSAGTRVQTGTWTDLGMQSWEPRLFVQLRETLTSILWASNKSLNAVALIDAAFPGGSLRSAELQSTPRILHPTPYTLLSTRHPTPFTLHPTPFSLPHTLRPTLYTLHATRYTLHPATQARNPERAPLGDAAAVPAHQGCSRESSLLTTY